MKAGQTMVGLAIFGVLAGLGAFLLRPPSAQSRESQEKSDGKTLPLVSQNALPEESTSLVESPSSRSASGGNAIFLLGSVQPGAQETISVRMPARIVDVRVLNGESVRQGQLLLRLDNAEGEAQERTAKTGVMAARAQLRKAQLGRTAQKLKSASDVTSALTGFKQAGVKLQQALLARDAAQADNLSEKRLAQEGVRKAEAALEQAQKSLHGLEELAKVGGVSRIDLEGEQTLVKVAQSDLDSAREQVQRLSAGPKEGMTSYRVALAEKDVEAARAGVSQAEEGVRTAESGRKQALALADQDIKAAEAGVSQADAGVSGTQVLQAQTRLTSSLNGIATNVTARMGEMAQPGVPLVTIVTLSGLHLEALVSARQLALLKVGQAAHFTVDTLPGKRFSAFLSEIARVAEADGRTFRLKFRFRSPVSLRPSQTARIQVDG